MNRRLSGPQLAGEKQAFREDITDMQAAGAINEAEARKMARSAGV